MLRGVLRKRRIGKGKFFKTKLLMVVKLRVFDLMKTRGLTSWIKGNTKEFAEDGFIVEVNRVIIDDLHIFAEAMKEGRGLELELDLPSYEGVMRAKGKVLWFKHTPKGSPYPFMAGVQLVEMGREEKKTWLKFTKGFPG
jgi:hypothetical protein